MIGEYGEPPAVYPHTKPDTKMADDLPLKKRGWKIHHLVTDDV
jgi:hypothetical protein